MKKVLFVLLGLIGFIACSDLQEIPKTKGSYKKSCRNCTWNDKQMTCICKMRANIYKKTSINTTKCKKGIENINGDLKCTQ